MIKYKIKLGAKHLNMEARMHKEMYKDSLKGMRCGRCHLDTTITFHQTSINTPPVSYLTTIIEACCPEFEAKIKARLKL